MSDTGHPIVELKWKDGRSIKIYANGWVEGMEDFGEPARGISHLNSVIGTLSYKAKSDAYRYFSSPIGAAVFAEHVKQLSA